MKFKRLKPGDTIGVIAPAYFLSQDSPRFKALEAYLSELGLKVKYGNNISSKYGYLAGTDEERVQDLMEMFLDQEVSAILAMLGGYGCSRIVDKIDYEIIKNNPKPLIGFSDITVLLNAIYQNAHIPTIHGAVGIYLGSPNVDSETLKDFRDLLFEKQLGRVLKNPNDLCEVINPGKTKGKIVGGNLSLINALMGTPYEIDFTEKLVFIEEVDEDPYRIDRFFSQLRLSRKLEKANGFIFGYFTDCNSKKTDSFTYIDLINQYFKDLNKPTLINFASGHNFPFVNLPIGVDVEMDAEGKTITILEELYETN